MSVTPWKENRLLLAKAYLKMQDFPAFMKWLEASDKVEILSREVRIFNFFFLPLIFANPTNYFDVENKQWLELITLCSEIINRHLILTRNWIILYHTSWVLKFMEHLRLFFLIRIFTYYVDGKRLEFIKGEWNTLGNLHRWLFTRFLRSDYWRFNNNNKAIYLVSE